MIIRNTGLLTKMLNFFMKNADRVSGWPGKTAAWLMLPLILELVYDTVARYIFNAPTVWSFDISYMIYRYLVDRKNKIEAKQNTVTSFKENLHYWYPREDFKSYLCLSKSGELTFLQWLKSLKQFPKVLPYWSIGDPKPSLIALKTTLSNKINQLKLWN